MAQISDYAMLGDCHSAALVSRAGSVDWWCPARFDAPSVFARLLDESAGHWALTPRAAASTVREYLRDTMVLVTELTTVGGSIRITDALLLGPGERGHEVGWSSPHVLTRRVEGLAGAVTVDLELVARPEYGLVLPAVTERPGGIELVGGADRLLLTGDRPLQVDADAGTVRGSFDVAAGERVVFALRHGQVPRPAESESRSRLPDPGEALEDTVAAWRSWAEEHQGYRGPYQQQVARSGLVLQALTYRPTGAVVAAPTTSLPEEVGGTANWDYRYGWLRDGSFTLKALWVAACPDESQSFFNWLARSMGPLDDGPVPVMLGVGGERDLSERQLDHLDGYAGSRPVRVGNAAWTQRQLDVLGEVLESAWVLRDQLDADSVATDALLRHLADRAAAEWRQPDAGIWEGREGERHYTTSKVMCWLALDRAIALGVRIGAQAADLTRWGEARQEVRAAVLEQAWHEEVGAFTGAFGSDHLDAGVLLIPLTGFLEPRDSRVLATLDVIERELSHGGLVQRWTGADDEGAFLICSYWLACARAMAGQAGRAREIFEQATGYANDLGLLSEEVDRRDGALIGNFPQGLSHIGLINAAWAIAQADEAAGPEAAGG